MTVTLEIVEGPGAGKQFQIDHPVVIGRDSSADLVIDDTQASRRHARLEPGAHGAVVEDLQSTNGTFINDNELHGRAELGPNDELLIGVTVMQLRTAQDIQRQPSAVRAVPPAFAAPETRPTFADAVTGDGATARPGAPPSSGVPELERLRDTRVKGKARLAPLAIFVIAALAVVIYLGLT
jgi:pSer/pThr/pTyr-binding forkhead associated (FHA) protein